MNEPQNNTLWLFLETLGRRRGLIISFVIITNLIAGGFSLLLSDEYDASALLLPPQKDHIQVVNMVDLGDGFNSIELSSMTTSADILVRILTSTTITHRIIDRFGLIERYNQDNYTDANRMLLDMSKIEATIEHLVFIGVTDRDAQMAADLANAYIDELYTISEEIISSGAKEKMVFFGDKLLIANEELAEARKNLEDFQYSNRAVNLEEQAKMVMEQAIELRIALSEIEIDLKVKKLSKAGSSPELAELRNRRRIVKEELDKLEYGSSDSSYFALPISAIPTLKGKYEVLYSRVRITDALSRLLSQQLEQAKIQESGSFPEFSVIQRAVKPEKSSRPNRKLIFFAAFLLSIMAALSLAVMKDYLERMKTVSPENYGRVEFFIKSYFGWLPGMKSKSE